MTEPNNFPSQFVEATQAAGLSPGVVHPAETRLVPEPEPVRDVIKIDQAQLHQHLDRIVRDSVEQPLHALLDAEADQLCGAKRYKRSPDRGDTRAGSYRRKLQTRGARAS